MDKFGKDVLVVNRRDETFGKIVKITENEECVVDCLEPVGRTVVSTAQLVPILKLKGQLLEMPLEKVLKRLKWKILAKAFKK